MVENRIIDCHKNFANFLAMTESKCLVLAPCCFVVARALPEVIYHHAKEQSLQ
ncbi:MULTISPECIES: hypothetical protein [Helicobacter]|uniref:hypothetical protein n=1 Tax=Helicobacter TaxID=209 RepID=UPI000AA6C3BC|nr:hypothetical protein [Helicobacter rodentium]